MPLYVKNSNFIFPGNTFPIGQQFLSSLERPFSISSRYLKRQGKAFFRVPHCWGRWFWLWLPCENPDAVLLLNWSYKSTFGFPGHTQSKWKDVPICFSRSDNGGAFTAFLLNLLKLFFCHSHSGCLKDFAQLFHKCVYSSQRLTHYRAFLNWACYPDIKSVTLKMLACPRDEASLPVSGMERAYLPLP